MARLAHAQGGLVGYVHPFDGRPDPERPVESLALPVDAALGNLDYLEVMGFSDHLITSDVWYRLLNCGFRIPAGAGTDAFPNFASQRGPVGLVRVYVRAGERLEHARVPRRPEGRPDVRHQRAAPVVHGRGTRARRDASAPATTRPLEAKVRMISAVPVDHVEIVGNGRVVATVPLRRRRHARGSDGPPARAGRRTGTCCARTAIGRGFPSSTSIRSRAPAPSTSRAAGRPARSRADAAYFATWIRRAEESVAAHTGWNTPAERAETLALLARARAEYERRAAP